MRSYPHRRDCASFFVEEIVLHDAHKTCSRAITRIRYKLDKWQAKDKVGTLKVQLNLQIQCI